MNDHHQDKRPAGWLSHDHKQGVRPWRRLRLSFLRWRRTVMANPHTARIYRFVVGGLGTLVVLIGLGLVPLPGPGWLIVIIGLFIISSEFRWAQRILHFVRVRVETWTDWIMKQPLWLRWTVGALSAVFVAILVWAVFWFIGVPDWVPELEVLKYLDLQ